MKTIGSSLLLVAIAVLSACNQNAPLQLSLHLPPPTSPTPFPYPALMYAGKMSSLNVYGLQNNGLIVTPALGTYNANNLTMPAGIGFVNSTKAQYITITDPTDGYIDVYTPGPFGLSTYVGYVVDTAGPYAQVYDTYYDDYFVINRSTGTSVDSMNVYSILSASPFLQYQYAVTVPANSTMPLVMSNSHNVYVGGTGTPNFYMFGPGSNKMLTPLSPPTWQRGSAIYYLGAIGNSGYFWDIDNGGGPTSPAQAEVWQDGTAGPTLSQQLGLGNLTSSTGACTSGASGPTYCYAAASGAILQYQFNPTMGGLSLLSPATAPAGSATIQSMTVNPFDTALYSLDASGNLTTYRIGSTGQLSQQGAPLTGFRVMLPAKYTF